MLSRGLCARELLSSRYGLLAGRQWLTPVILATQEVEIRRITVQSQPRQIVLETLSQKYPSQKGLVEWLKVKALSSSPSNTHTHTHTHTHTNTTYCQELFPENLLLHVRDCAMSQEEVLLLGKRE
jgi:hypothetical protein